MRLSRGRAATQPLPQSPMRALSPLSWKEWPPSRPSRAVSRIALLSRLSFCPETAMPWSRYTTPPAVQDGRTTSTGSVTDPSENGTESPPIRRGGSLNWRCRRIALAVRSPLQLRNWITCIRCGSTVMICREASRGQQVTWATLSVYRFTQTS